MDSGSELVSLSITSLSELVRRREVSPVQLAEAVLARIDAVEPVLNCHTTVLHQEAIEQAREAEREIASGLYRGPLHGIPIGLKDLLWTKGVHTTAGSAALEGFVPDADATVVSRLRSHGAVFVGKHNLHEFACGVTNENVTFGPARNPWNADRIPGGSSGGSAAAVSVGGCFAALGSDTGGSIRIPAACCGVVGLLPTYGRVSRYGAVPLSWSLDHIGPITRVVSDAALLLGAVAGRDPLDPTTDPRPVVDYRASLESGVVGLRLGIPRGYFYERVDPEVRSAIERAIEVLVGYGATTVTVDVPNVELSLACQNVIALAEASTWHRPLIARARERYGPAVLRALEAGEMIPATNYLKAQRARVLIKHGLASAMTKADVLVTPTIPVPALEIGQSRVVVDGIEESILDCLLRFTCPVNLSGQPAISIPCGFTASGLPIGMQLIGRPFEEGLICRVAFAYEQAARWPTVPPAARSSADREERA